MSSKKQVEFKDGAIQYSKAANMFTSKVGLSLHKKLFLSLKLLSGTGILGGCGCDNV
jgi:hypothetical protein